MILYSNFFCFWWLSAIHLSIVIRKRTLIIVARWKPVCPDRPRREVHMSRFSCFHQIFVRSYPNFRAFMSRLSCVQQIFVRLCPDVRAFFRVSRLCKFESTTTPSGTSTWVCFQCSLTSQGKINYFVTNYTYF